MTSATSDLNAKKKKKKKKSLHNEKPFIFSFPVPAGIESNSKTDTLQTSQG